MLKASQDKFFFLFIYTIFVVIINNFDSTEEKERQTTSTTGGSFRFRISIFEEVFVVELDVGGVDVVELDPVHVLEKQSRLMTHFKHKT